MLVRAISSIPLCRYVMLSRCQSLEQLYIVNSLDPAKITVNEKVIEETLRMHKVSLNMNPCNWMNPETRGLKVCSFNTRSLRKHMEDIRNDPVLMESDVLFVQETWLETSEEEEERYQLEGYRAHFASQGRGKGIAAYVKNGVRGSRSIFVQPNFQLVMVDTAKLAIIAIYRSNDEPLSQVIHHLRQRIDPSKNTLIVGDLNICATKNNIMGNYLQQEGFRQLVTLPTHICGGIQLQLDFIRCFIYAIVALT